MQIQSHEKGVLARNKDPELVEIVPKQVDKACFCLKQAIKSKELQGLESHYQKHDLFLCIKNKGTFDIHKCVTVRVLRSDEAAFSEMVGGVLPKSIVEFHGNL